MPVTLANIAEYVRWDEMNKRYDLTPKALDEQFDEEVRSVMFFVLRSWFIPQLTPVIARWFEPKVETPKTEVRQLTLW
jgi:hypothetical protein